MAEADCGIISFIKDHPALQESRWMPILETCAKAFNRSDLINTLLEHAGIDKKQAVAVLDTLKDIMVAHLVPGGPQHFKWPELFTMKIKEKAATKARQGVNPFTGEPTTFSAKPAQQLVKITALNGLKASIEEQA